ncbi:MAG: hypothetical protein RMZ42_05095 [Nostoc sp. DedQUE05]|nr:hypothetical protein [Nostoc sp. DedQUE05]MDZ8091302.1 hypothetical protein [Nostoc sp. DedQUE05]
MTTNLPVVTEIIPMVLQLQPAIAMTDNQFYEFCQYFLTSSSHSLSSDI